MAGNPYVDRHGVLQNAEPRDLTGLTLRAWCEAKGVAYS